MTKPLGGGNDHETLKTRVHNNNYNMQSQAVSCGMQRNAVVHIPDDLHSSANSSEFLLSGYVGN